VSRIIVFMLMLSTIALASNTEHANSDILQRTVNFLLFTGLVWYLVAEPIKNFFAARSQAIADEMQKVQDKLKESIAQKKEALSKISDAEKFSEDLVVSSKKENKIINDNIMAQCESDLDILNKQQNGLMDFEQRKMVREVVENILSEILSQNNEDFDKKAMANVILKKVA